MAKKGSFEEIPPAIYIRHKASLNSIYIDNIQVEDRDVEIICYHGPAGVGKSVRAKYVTHGMSVFRKDPTSKWWDGYKGEEAVIVDEYYGDWPLSNFLIWCDRYGSRGEIKGGSCPLLFKKMIFTSNVDPCEWYPKASNHHRAAIKRRLEVNFMPNDSWLNIMRRDCIAKGVLKSSVSPACVDNPATPVRMSEYRQTQIAQLDSPFDRV